MKWTRVAVGTSAEAAEAVALRLEILGAGGVVIEDPGLLARKERESPLDYFDGTEASPDEFRIVAYWPQDGELSRRLADLQEFLTELPGFGLDPGAATVATEAVDEEDWAGAWKTYYRPQRFGRVVVCPSWEECDVREGEVLVRLDPGMAFGTGGHPSTALCLEALSRTVQGRESMIDVGTGSGILAIAAAKLGADSILALDVDPQAVRVAQENILANDLSKSVQTQSGDAKEILSRTDPADLVMANIIAEVIIDLAPDLAQAVNPGGALFAAGIISAKRDAVKERLETAGLRYAGESERDGWVCLEFARPRRAGKEVG